MELKEDIAQVSKVNDKGIDQKRTDIHKKGHVEELWVWKGIQMVAKANL